VFYSTTANSALVTTPYKNSENFLHTLYNYVKIQWPSKTPKSFS